MGLDPKQIRGGIDLFLKEIDNLMDDNPELSDYAEAFEEYCARRFSLGSTATIQRTGGKFDRGIDFYSSIGHIYHIGQCKVPRPEWLESNPHKPRSFGPSGVDDLRHALRYLIGDTQAKANDRVKFLYSCIEKDRSYDDFAITFSLIVYGELNSRARESFNELKQEVQKHKINIKLIEIEDLVDQFAVGSDQSAGDIRFPLHFSGDILREHDYCYLLANSADLYRAFHSFGWRLFDVNLRYEIKNSPVNADMINTLRYQKSRRRFHHFNNGLIIMVQNYSIDDRDKFITLRGAQIVNGLQTVKSIYNAVIEKEVRVDELDKDCQVQVKIIQSQDHEFISNVVQNTNNQNPMAQRNLKANTREQKDLRRKFSLLPNRWFLQVKEGQWTSLTQESARFFKEVVGYSPSEFKPDPSGKKGRIIDNQDLAKAWLAFICFADLAGERVTHYFTEKDVYQKIFQMRPTESHWKRFADSVDFNVEREANLENYQGEAEQFLLAFTLWQFTRFFIPSAQKYREIGLEEGVRAGKLKKSGGSVVNSNTEKDEWLASNSTFQTWRLMANMKELIVEVGSQLLSRKYGPLTGELCKKILESFDASEFIRTNDIRDVAQQAAGASDMEEKDVFGRIFELLRYSTTQFWVDKQTILQATSRPRTILLGRDKAADFKQLVWEVNERKALDRPWKVEGKTFLESLPNLD